MSSSSLVSAFRIAGTADQFENFFEGNTKVAEIAAAAGVKGPPSVSVLSTVEAPGTF